MLIQSIVCACSAYFDVKFDFMVKMSIDFLSVKTNTNDRCLRNYIYTLYTEAAVTAEAEEEAKKKKAQLIITQYVYLNSIFLHHTFFNM